MKTLRDQSPVALDIPLTGSSTAGTLEVTREARIYAVTELARRAGVASAFLNSWKIDCNEQETVLWVQPGTDKCIRFRNSPRSHWRELSRGIVRTTKVHWFQAPKASWQAYFPDLLVPFSHRPSCEPEALFKVSSPGCVECEFDLPLTVLLSLSRWEETLPGDRDQHGRFSSAMSFAVRDGFLNRPIVDEYGLALEQVLTYLLPEWKPAVRTLHVKLSHDVDHVGLPLNVESTIGHTLRRHCLPATLRDLLSLATDIDPAYLFAVRKIATLSLNARPESPTAHNIDSAVYWKASPRGEMDSGYDPRHPKIRRMIAWLRDHGVENGIHPGYETFLAPDKLKSEVDLLREILGDQPLGGRQHYLRWCPETWRHWESCGLAYDSSVGYADRAGFRAGTCIPYRPWLFRENREARLVEVPLIVMDVTFGDGITLNLPKLMDAVADHISRCHAVGGVFTLLWHNNNLIKPAHSDMYAQLIGRFSGQAVFHPAEKP